MAVRIVTDSTADLPPDVAKQLNISVVPLLVFFGEEGFRDGVDIDSDRFYRMLVESPIHPRTSQPAVGDFLTVYQRLAEEGTDGIVSIHLSSRLSGTVSSANAAREEFGDRCAVAVVDSQNVSLGLGMIVIAAAEAARAGAGLEEVRRVAEDAARRTHILFVLDTLEHLQRGGRIGRAQAFIGSLLHVKPLLTVRDGEVHPLERLRTRPRAIDRLLELIAAHKAPVYAAVADATTPADADSLEQRMHGLFPEARILRSRIGPVLGAHAGPGVIGVGVLDRADT